ncbi:hypothetical protein LSS_12127 [Leptospira santarosai serovar Shermani str. LT 821]|uniref:Uncharacterized protein n=1 Tax=Leptospira santarosai serovar Shermani str. LT 821 TaxID=758847 RepID=K8XYC5_9LEPT|nr:hypothetical protein LSS_12127 [Leptospira santarosai serovar Shermani str. LT 821]
MSTKTYKNGTEMNGELEIPTDVHFEIYGFLM